MLVLRQNQLYQLQGNTIVNQAQGDIKEHVDGLILVRYVQVAARMQIHELLNLLDGILLIS